MRNVGYRTCLLLMALPITTVGLALVGLALWLEPNDGDLTRLGGYAENDYGWTGEQLAFRPALASYAAPGEQFEVLVLGDSFSRAAHKPAGITHDEASHWTDFFAARTGLSVGALHRDETTLPALLRSENWKTSPPKLLVLEYAERTLAWVKTDGQPCDDLPPPLDGNVTAHPGDTSQGEPYRRARDHRISTEALDTALDIVTKTVPRWAAGLNETPVSRARLSRADLFTDRSNADLLLYKDDLSKRDLRPAFLQALGCSFRRMQAAVEANGVTRFVLMVAPDRSTAYTAYMPDLGIPNVTAIIARTPGLRMVRLDQAMQAAAAAGTKDIYWPNDTHWAIAGKQIAANALAEAVTEAPPR